MHNFGFSSKGRFFRSLLELRGREFAYREDKKH
jgi:hypothetical protein